MKKFLKRLRKQEGLFGIETVAIGIAVLCFGLFFVNDVANMHIQPILDVKNKNPDAIVSLSLTPLVEEFDDKDILIKHGKITDAGEGWQFDKAIGRWTYAPHGINDPARGIYYEEYEGTSKEWVLAPDGLSSHRRQIYDEERKRWQYVYEPHVEDYLSGKRIGLSRIYEDEQASAIDIIVDSNTIEAMHAAETWQGPQEAEPKAQESILNTLVSSANSLSSSMQVLINKTYFEEKQKDHDIDTDIQETILEAISDQADTNTGSDIFSIVASTIQSIPGQTKDLFARSKLLVDGIRQELAEQTSLAEEELVRQRKEIKRHALSIEYNEAIIARYEAIEQEGYIITNPSGWAEAKRRVAYAQGKIRELEDEIGKREMVAQIQPDIIAEDPAKIEDTAQEAYTIEESSTDFEEVQDADTAFTIIPEDIADGNIVKGTIPESIINNNRTWALSGKYTWTDYMIGSEPGGYMGFGFRINENGLDFFEDEESYYQYSYYLDYPMLYIRSDNLLNIFGKTIADYLIVSLKYSSETHSWTGTFNHIRKTVDPDETLTDGGPAECIPTGGSHDFSW